MHSRDEVDRALQLRVSGLNASQVARETGIPRSSVRNWLAGCTPDRGQRREIHGCFRCTGDVGPFPLLTKFAYAYLLGIYLGDGYVARVRRVHRLEVVLDSRHPVIAAECAGAMRLAMPMSRATLRRHSVHNYVNVTSYAKHWLCLFPQHGPGLKHTREIRLLRWQRGIVDRYPWRFLRGLIQSDGCRSLNTIKRPKRTYSYPRYSFSNRSDDIRGLFTEYCDVVGVEWRQMNAFNISVARRASVELMDRYIGPKH